MIILKSILIPSFKKLYLFIILIGCSGGPDDLSVIPRDHWGAYSSFFPDKLKEYRTTGDSYHGIIIHYSGFSNTLRPKEIQVYHLTKMGYADINYHYIIDNQGSIYEGRDLIYKVESFSLYENYIHICCISDMKFSNGAWLKNRQKSALIKLIKCLIKEYDIENKYIKYFDSTGYECVNFSM